MVNSWATDLDSGSRKCLINIRSRELYEIHLQCMIRLSKLPIESIPSAASASPPLLLPLRMILWMILDNTIDNIGNIDICSVWVEERGENHGSCENMVEKPAASYFICGGFLNFWVFLKGGKTNEKNQVLVLLIK